MEWAELVLLYLMNMFFQFKNVHNHWRSVWTYDDLLTTPRCSTEGKTQGASFADCSNGRVNMAYDAPYDFKSIMHYGLKE